jgi:hypothetical protein
MKKSLVLMVVLVGSLALAGSVFAGGMAKSPAPQCGGWDCYSTPTCQPAPCKDRVLCKGQAKGIEKMCGPCAPTIKWAGKWMTIEKCPAAPKVAKKAVKKVAKKGKFVK